jgi:hypothetical protein
VPKTRLPSSRLLAALVAALVATGVGGSVRADTITFDPDGLAGGNGNQSVTGFDYLPGNAVTINGAPLSANSVGQTFTTLYQATLGGYTPGSSPSAPIGLNSAFEITVVAQFKETVTSVSVDPVNQTATVNFTTAANQAGSFLQIYYDNNPATFSNALNGTGYNDGQLILAGSIVKAPGDLTNFTADENPADYTLLDSDGGDDRGGQLTLQGSGGSKISANVFFVDPNFFKTGLAQISTRFNTSLIVPFSEVEPSKTFFNGYTPTLGAVNGVSGPDFQFQADANESFTLSPEPSTMGLALAGLGLASLGSLRKLRRRSESSAA